MIEKVHVFAEEKDYFGCVETFESWSYRPYKERVTSAIDKMHRRHNRGLDDYLHLHYDDGGHDVIFFEGGVLTLRRYKSFNSRDADKAISWKDLYQLVCDQYEW